MGPRRTPVTGRGARAAADAAGDRAAVLDDLSDERLAAGSRSATPFLTDAEGLTVAQCLKVVLNEEWEHRLYAERDLAVLAAR